VSASLIVVSANDSTVDVRPLPRDWTQTAHYQRFVSKLLSQDGDGERAWLVDSTVQWDDGPVGVVRFSWIRRAAEVPDRAAFARHWGEVHAPLARQHHPGLCRYVQHVVVRPLHDDAGSRDDVDGIAELGFATLDDLEHRMYDSEEGRAIVMADIKSFLDLDAGWRVLVTR
jgi:uncharacterized protein (TIGR02118 family)